MTELSAIATKRKEMVEREKEFESGPRGLGSVEAITGPMCCGKTDEIIKRLREAEIAGHKVQVFRPDIDEEYLRNNATSHSGNKLDAVPVKEVQQIKELLKEDTSIVAIDDVHFFSDEIAPFVQELADQGTRVIIAGLNMDFRGETFGPMPVLMAQSEILDTCHAICMVCGEQASFTQRLIDDKPACYGDPTVVVGASELYEARCRRHHKVPEKP